MREKTNKKTNMETKTTNTNMDRETKKTQDDGKRLKRRVKMKS